MKQLISAFKLLLLTVILLTGGTTYSQPDDEKVSDLFEMSLDELLNVEITTVSRYSEEISKAPGTVIVITSQELRERGYTALSEILDDLPGMDIVRPYGDNYLKNYWRGYRHDSGSAYLLLLNGMSLNSHSFNDPNIMEALPLRSIERIEVVYGPTSSIYGANALSGLINVITKKPSEPEESSFGVDAVFGTEGDHSIDAFGTYTFNDINFFFASRFNDSDNLTAKHNEFEWTKDRYANDPDLWGEFIYNPSIGGVESPHVARSLLLQVGLHNIELGFQYLRTENGYGTQYPFDRTLPNGKWVKESVGYYAKYETDINNLFHSSTLLRMYETDIPNETYSVEAYTGGSGSDTYRAPLFEYWQMLAHSIEFTQQFDFTPNDDLKLSLGTVYNTRDVQKGYDYVTGPFLPVDSIRIDDYPFPEPPSDDYRYQNRGTMTDKGVYGQAKYVLAENNIFYLGSRYDDHSIYGGELTTRASYIRMLNDFNIRLLYGEAFNEPTPRMLYGGWTALGYNTQLVPERSSTLELCVAYNTPLFTNRIVGYYMQNWNTILNVSSGVRNIGERDAFGIEYHFRWHPEVDFLYRLKIWGYYSYIYSEGDEIYLTRSDTYQKAETGDLAPHKVQFGVTAYYNKQLSLTLYGRYISERNTVASNPVRTVDAFTVIDLNLRYTNILNSGIGAAVRIKNLFDTLYYHPGIVSANSGTDPGYFDTDGTWVGSKGWYSSLLPQMGRQIYLSFSLDL